MSTKLTEPIGNSGGSEKGNSGIFNNYRDKSKILRFVVPKKAIALDTFDIAFPLDLNLVLTA
jgi:hypothetical protein